MKVFHLLIFGTEILSPLYYTWRRWCNNTNLILQKTDTKLSVLLSVEVFIQFKLIFTEVISVYWIAHNAESKTDLTRERKKIKRKEKDYLKKMFCGEEEAFSLVNCEVWLKTQHTALIYHICTCTNIGTTELVAVNTFWLHRTLSSRIYNSAIFRIITKEIKSLIKELRSTSFLLIGSTCNTWKWFVGITRFF